MYRSLIPAILYISAVTSAPQSGNSDITYVKIQPLDRLANHQAQARSPYRESRIEILPLTISGNNKSLVSTRNLTTSEDIDDVGQENASQEYVSEEEDILESSEKGDPNAVEVPEAVIVPEVKENDSKSNSVPENNRHARSQEVTESYEDDATTTEAVTEGDSSIEELAKKTEEYETRTKAPAPRFISKLSYFSKQERTPSFSTNLVERPAKRRFKSKCRCEKIWNCPKLQITVPRCPNEYFLCCF